MELKEILLGGGGAALVLMTLIQIAPIKINPWSALAGMFGRALNAEVMAEIKKIEARQKQTQDQLANHIRVDDDRNADSHRQRILQFNTELLRDIPHTREDFIEILADIDFYEQYCSEHKDYKNSRAVHAIANIGRVYDDRLKKHDFL